ncbi:cytochrome P450 CYP82D47-like [Juglans microcarpa x Juglans regia]|uniref:cytochrome P450 CYP82D47-like n=1 Tax=Juglans microcarpa x Juglans regia TaxID=2249226 RepID=UPI001B7F1135|nr:cytochrome P450 CYP82D47-like [Juglans microcarpa x Juglans regia]
MDFLSLLSPCLNSVVVGALAIALLFFHLLRRSKDHGLLKTPPSPTGAWPIVGHLPLLGGSELPHKTLGVMADKYGPALTIQIGLHPALVLSNWEVAKECFTTNDVAVSSRPKLVASKHMGYNYAMFGLADYGSYWRELRKIVTVELLSNRRLELLSHVRVSEVETSLEQLYKLWTKHRDNSGQIMVELKQWIGDMNLNLIVRMVAGKRYDFSTSTGDHNKEKVRRWQKAWREFFRLLGLFAVSDAIPCLAWLDLGGHEKAMKRIAKELDSIIGEWLEDHKRKRALGEGKGEQDFMDVLLSILNGADQLAGNDADTIIKATCSNLIAGGSDTNTVTLTWAISLLLNNRHVLKKAQDELDILVGKERVVEDSDISKLVYLQAIVKETLRLYPAAPLGAPREFNEDCIIGGYHVPKGTRLITNIWKIQTDSQIWSDPLEFKPERFLSTHKDFDVRGKKFELIPFGSGRRVCPGATFALQVVHLTLARIFQMFEISTPLNAQVDMTESFGLTNMKATPLEVLIKPRLPSKLYALKTIK